MATTVRPSASARLPARVLALALALTGATALGVLGPSPAHARASGLDHGRTWTGDKTLRAGCHRYRFRYEVAEGHTEWMLEVRLRGPEGDRLASSTLDGDADPRRGRGGLGLCGAATTYGRHRITARLTWWTPGEGLLDPPVAHHARLPATVFRMRRPGWRDYARSA